MTPSGLSRLLLDAICVSALLNWPVTFILVRASLRRPRITFLWTVAVSSLLISVGTTGYLTHALTHGLVLPDTETLVFRVVLLAAAAFPIWWLWLYLTGRFQ